MGSIYPESFDSAQDSALSAVERAEQAPPLAGRVEGLPFDPSTRPLALLRIVVREWNESNHDFAQGKCTPIVQGMLTCNWGRI